MTVSTAYTPLSFSGNSATTAFAVSWPFLTGTLVVTEISSTGVETVKSIGTHYTVSGGTTSEGLPSTGTVTMLSAPATGTTLRITRATPKTNATTWSENDGFPQKVIEAAFDKLTLIAQESAAGGSDDITGDVLQLNSSGATDYWDGEAKPLRNLANGEASTDAATVGQINDLALTAGAGNVVGPASASDGRIALFDGTTGKLLKDSGSTVAALEASATAAALAAVRDGVSSSFDTLAELAAGKAPAAATYIVKTAHTDLSAEQALSALATGVLKNTTGTGDLSIAAATDLGAGRHTIYVPAVALVARTTNGAAAGTVETSTNKVMFSTLDFDATTTEFAQFAIRMPKCWNEGTITARFVWSHAATTTNFGVAWAINAVALSDGDAGDAAFGTGQGVTDTGGTTNMIYVTSETAGMTIAGTPAAEDWVVFQVYRLPADAGDTMAIDARLHGVSLYLTTDAITDA